MLEQLTKRLDEHCDPGQAAALGTCTGSTQGQERNDTTVDSSGIHMQPCREPSFN